MSRFFVGERVVCSGHGLMDVKAEIRMGQRVLVLRCPRWGEQILMTTEDARTLLRFPLSRDAARRALDMLLGGDLDLSPDDAWDDEPLRTLQRGYRAFRTPSAEERNIERIVVTELEYVLGMREGSLLESLHARYPHFRDHLS